MIKAVIIEDEKNAAEYLSGLLKELEPELMVDAVLPSVEKASGTFPTTKKQILFSATYSWRMDFPLLYFRLFN